LPVESSYISFGKYLELGIPYNSLHFAYIPSQVLDSDKDIQMASQNLNKCSVFSVPCKLHFRSHFYSVYYTTFFSYLTSFLLDEAQTVHRAPETLSIMMYLIASENRTLISVVNLWMT
jgi:hypothetical protein